VFCVGDGNNLVEEGDEEDEGKKNQIDVDNGNNGGKDDGDTNSNNVDANNYE
jgi:hypothetical protein